MLPDEGKNEYYRKKILEILKEFEKDYRELKCTKCGSNCSNTVRVLETYTAFIMYVFGTVGENAAVRLKFPKFMVYRIFLGGIDFGVSLGEINDAMSSVRKTQDDKLGYIK